MILRITWAADPWPKETLTIHVEGKYLKALPLWVSKSGSEPHHKIANYENIWQHCYYEIVKLCYKLVQKLAPRTKFYSIQRYYPLESKRQSSVKSFEEENKSDIKILVLTITTRIYNRTCKADEEEWALNSSNSEILNRPYKTQTINSEFVI